VDELGLEVAVDFIAEPADEDVDDVGLGVEVVIPDVLEDHGFGDDLVLVAEEVFEEEEFTGLEIDFGRAAPDFAGEEVHFEIGEGEAGDDGGGAGAPDEGLEASEQFGEGEGLGEVIVAAALEAGNAVVERAFGAEDEDGEFDLFGAPAFDDAEAVELGKHEVDDGGVVGIFTAEFASFFAVGADVDDISGFAKAFGDESGYFGVVFKKEDFHVGIQVV